MGTWSQKSTWIKLVFNRINHLFQIKVHKASHDLKPETRGQYWNYCSETDPCEEGAGDCDSDSECQEGLKCGEDNCGGYLFKTTDCCYA